MNYRTAGIIYYQGKVYVPSEVETESGLHIIADPVLVTDVDLEQMGAAVEKVLLAPRPRVPDIPREEWGKRKDPVLMATGAKSWKELARKGSSYNFDWTEKHKRLDISFVDKQGRWQYDPAKVQIFPVDTPLEVIIKIILEDIRSRI